VTRVLRTLEGEFDLYSNSTITSWRVQNKEQRRRKASFPGLGRLYQIKKLLPKRAVIIFPEGRYHSLTYALSQFSSIAFDMSYKSSAGWFLQIVKGFSPRPL
jgi:hypothetical protein